MRIAGWLDGMDAMLFPRQDEVLEIHRRMVQQSGGTWGVRDEGLLESALNAPAIGGTTKERVWRCAPRRMPFT